MHLSARQRRVLRLVASFAPAPAPLGVVMRAANPLGERTINACVVKGLLDRSPTHPTTLTLTDAGWTAYREF